MSSAIGIPESYGFSPEVIKCVQDMIDACISDGKYLAGWEAIQEVLIAKGLASTIQMPPDYVGVHPDNRSKFGLTGPDSHAHGEEILDIGFSWKKAADATAQELPPPGQPRHDDAVQANNDLVRYYTRKRRGGYVLNKLKVFEHLRKA